MKTKRKTKQTKAIQRKERSKGNMEDGKDKGIEEMNGRTNKRRERQ
jgi:hypothetical protein